MPKLKCSQCGHEEKVPMHCGQAVHVEKVTNLDMLVCWMGPECGKQTIPTHCGAPMQVQG